MARPPPAAISLLLLAGPAAAEEGLRPGSVAWLEYRGGALAILVAACLGALTVLVALVGRLAYERRRAMDMGALAFLVAQALHAAIASGFVSTFRDLPAGPLQVAGAVTAGATAWAGCQFLRHFLDVGRRGPRLDRALAASGTLALALSAVALVSIPAGTALVAAAALAALALAAAALAGALAGRHAGARLLAPGLIIYLASTAWYLLALLGLAPGAPVVLLAQAASAALVGQSILVAVSHRDWTAANAREDGLERQAAERTVTLSQTVEALERQVRERQRAEERFRLAFETYPDAVSLSRLSDGVFVALNRGFLKLHGLRGEEVLGRSAEALGLWAEGDRAAYVETLRRDGHVRDLEMPLTLRSGEPKRVVLCAATLESEGETYILATARDVTAQREAEAFRARAEAELRQAQKLDAIGRLAAGVAHDFNNFLTAVGANLSMALEGLADDDGNRLYLLDAEDGLRRAAGLTQQLLSFSRKQPEEARAVSVDEVVGGMERLLRRLAGEEIQLHFKLAGDLPPVRADVGQLEQVVLNLVVNARDAVRAGGTVEVETSLVRRGPGARPGEQVRLAVRDDGVGMDEATRRRIFEPFFTTKESGKGTGLGLATVYAVVQRHRGALEVTSAPGRGSTFEVFLPVDAAGEMAEVAAPPRPRPASPAPPGTGASTRDGPARPGPSPGCRR